MSASSGTPFLKPKLRQETSRRLVWLLVAEAAEDVGAQLVHVEVRSVDQRVGDVADGVEQLPLFDDGARDRFRPAQRVRPARLRVAAHQHGVLRVEKDHARGSSFLTRLRISGRRSSVCPSRTSTTMAARRSISRTFPPAGKIGQQFQRQIVDGVKAQILKALSAEALPAPEIPVTMTRC
jgi:hypothetical protein